MILPLLILPALLLIWGLVLHPYQRRHGRRYRSPAGLHLGIFRDWQEASETAKENGDLGILFACRLFALLSAVEVFSLFWIILNAE